MQAFGEKRCHFVRRYQKTKKPKVFLESWRRRSLKSPKSLFFCFWYLSRKMQAFGGKRCHFVRRYQKTKKPKDFRVLAKARPEESNFFLFFWVPFQENTSFWWKTLPFCEEVPKNQKTQRFYRVLAKARPEESKIFVFFFWVFLWVPLQENASFWWKTLPFCEEVPKNQKTQSFFRVLAKAKPEESKIFVFLFLVPSRKMQAFGGKRCHFVRRYQKNQKNPKIF